MKVGQTRRYFDPYLLVLISVIVIGILLPLSASQVQGLEFFAKLMVVALFFVYGAKLSSAEVIKGIANLRVQAAILFCTFIVFPVIGIALHHILSPLLTTIATGVLYLSLLPSTVQSSVAFTAIAKGNVAEAITAATISSLIGMIITPLYVGIFMGTSAPLSFSSLKNIVLQLLLPFVVGQILHKPLGPVIEKHSFLPKIVDRGTIFVVVGSASATARFLGIWKSINLPMLAALLLVSGILLALMLSISWQTGALLKLPRPSRIALLMCGSKKSLGTGIPMALILFPPASAATVVVPVIVFHQLQLAICSVLANQLARNSAGSK